MGLIIHRDKQGKIRYIPPRAGVMKVGKKKKELVHVPSPILWK